MIFSVKRTRSRNEKPCDEVIAGKCIRVDTREVDTPSKLTFESQVEDWYNRGENHRVVDGRIKRDFIEDGWLIEIGTIDELISFCQRHGDIILSYEEGANEIEIYDDYRE